MTKQINVKVVCACGEEVTEKEDIREKIDKLFIEYYDDSIPNVDEAADKVLAHFEKDRPAEPERLKPCSYCKFRVST